MKIGAKPEIWSSQAKAICDNKTLSTGYLEGIIVKILDSNDGVIIKVNNKDFRFLIDPSLSYFFNDNTIVGKRINFNYKVFRMANLNSGSNQCLEVSMITDLLPNK
ncbi:MAG: hypothetical protein LBE80_03960 [Deltaproteobacteria bacterium]|nr:hypothetical protein [Deltaproteobacteria bacterium]